MNFLILSALALVVLPEATFAIYGGETAGIGQFPYQVRLMMTDAEGHMTSCGGSIIGINWILTASHCLDTYVPIANVTIFMGTNQRYPSNYQPLVVTKENLITHKEFKLFNKRNDIALIKTPSITLSRLVQIVKLPPINRSYDLSYYDGKDFIISGWGKSDRSTSELQYIRMSGVNIDECIKIHSYRSLMINRERNVCTAAPNKASTCFGDSGGPLVMNVTESDGSVTLRQCGILSVGTSEVCDDGKPNVFTRVDYYLQWILDHTGISY